MATRLDGPTLFVEQARPYIVTWHKQAREACIRRDLGPCDRSSKGGEVDEERSRRNSVQRACSRVRVLAKANGLCRLMTLTFAEAEHDREAVLGFLAIFGRKLQAVQPRVRFLYVLEHHPGGHGYHVHLGFSKFVPKEVVAKAWGRGFVDLRRIKSKKSGFKQTAGDVSRYLTKYLTKCAYDTPKGKRRFSGSHNLVDDVFEATFETFAEADSWVRSVQRVLWEMHISPETVEGWRGPPCWLYR